MREMDQRCFSEKSIGIGTRTFKIGGRSCLVHLGYRKDSAAGTKRTGKGNEAGQSSGISSCEILNVVERLGLQSER